MSTNNPMGTDGFEFLEFCSPDPQKLAKQFQAMGFQCIAKHRSKQVTLYRQNQINFIINAEPDSLASDFAQKHGAGCCAMGFRVKDAKAAHQRAVELGATAYETRIGPGELTIPAILGVGCSLIYFVDHYNDKTIYDTDFTILPNAPTNLTGVGLTYIDHLTHNLYRGQMDKWNDFYRNIFNFHEIRFFNIKGQSTGLISRALASPCGKIKIPLNESLDDASQIEEFLHEYHGEGIQHIALGTDNIYETVEQMQANKIKFLDVPDTYYEVLDERIADHGEDLARMQRDKILIDGNPHTDEGLLLHILRKNL